jgi:SAM-dependent methyltransferase
MPSWIWIVLLLLGSFFIFKIAYALSIASVLPFTRGAVYVSTSSTRIAAFLQAVPMRSHQRLVDLGCGDGRVLKRAWQAYGVTGLGYEINPFAYFKARLRCVGIKGVEIKCRSFWKADLSEADVVFCYLFPDVMKPLSEKLRSELKPGAVVVSCNFALPDWHAEQVLRPNNPNHGDPIYIYYSGSKDSRP